LIQAVASCGRTFSLGEPFSMVGAMVVCSMAAPAGVLAVWLTSSGENSQVLAAAILMVVELCGARLFSMSAPGPLNFIGKGWSAMASTALARVVTPVWAGGAEEWPPTAGAVTVRVA
jgi:hypothetical protein